MANRVSVLPPELLTLVWGPVVKQEVFCRWSQGFIFSRHENTALIQTSGGPCAVIAPVQAFLLKNMISIYQLQQLRELDEKTVDKYLCSALVDLLSQCRANVNAVNSLPDMSLSFDNDNTANEYEGPYQLACLDDPLPPVRERSPISPAEIDCGHLINLPSRDHDLFHSCVRLRHFESRHELESYLEINVIKFKIEFGILLFLYSVILTRGIHRIKSEIGEYGESLIDQYEGHGGQALINLLINGRASSYVWDGDKDVGGLMLFSWSKKLITPDSECERAKQVFSWFDAEGNKFIQRSQLKQVLDKLSLCTDDDFVEFMCKELDPENVGVILFSKFLEAFFNCDEYSPPDTFKLYHYNGLESSCPNNKIMYGEGIAALQESHVKYSSSSSEILACLATKWANIDVQWVNFQPSLN